MFRCARMALVGVVVVALLGVSAPTAVGGSVAQGPSVAKGDKDCSDFPTWRKAQRFFKRHHPRRDPHRLDADHDGIACEHLPGAPRPYPVPGPYVP